MYFALPSSFAVFPQHPERDARTAIAQITDNILDGFMVLNFYHTNLSFFPLIRSQKGNKKAALFRAAFIIGKSDLLFSWLSCRIHDLKCRTFTKFLLNICNDTHTCVLVSLDGNSHE